MKSEANSYRPNPRRRKKRIRALHALKGHPGVGKSTLADALAALLGPGSAIIISKDAARAAALTGDGATEPRPDLNAAANAAAVASARTALAGPADRVVILDTTLSSEALFESACAAAGGARIAVVEVVMSGSDAAWDARLRGRPTEGHKPGNLDDVRALITSYGDRDAWVASRVRGRGGSVGPHHPGFMSGPAPLALPGEEEVAAPTGLYVCLDTGVGASAAALAASLEQVLREWWEMKQTAAAF